MIAAGVPISKSETEFPIAAIIPTAWKQQSDIFFN